MSNQKDFVLDVLKNSRPDDFYRAEAAFRGLSPEEMEKEHGQSGATRKEILEGYRKRLKEWDEAIKWVAGL